MQIAHDTHVMPNIHFGHAVTDLDTWLHPTDSLRIGGPRWGRHDRTRSRRFRRKLAGGVLTFLFTDIEGSTRRWENDPVTMMSSLELHNRVLLEAIEGHGGRVFSYAGDGVCAVFVSPSCAVAAAVDAQRVLKLPVRMGIASGEAETRGGDYFGSALNRTARVMAAGHGGQILLDGASAALLHDVDVMDLGPRRLRDIAKPVEIFQVVAPGLPVAFPPLRTADRDRGNLSVRTDSFVGRQDDVAGVCAALDAHRLVTLTGVGGVGKTRLATEVAAGLSRESSDEVWLIDLALIDDPADVPGAVADVLRLPYRPETSLTKDVATALAGRGVLLVFDNCEHVLDAVSRLIEALVAYSADIKVLATSRERLGVAGERLWRVDPLGTGPDAAGPALFRDRAQEVTPGISLESADECAAMTEICRRVDGIPLAIELAAARLVSMTLTELRDRLDEPLRILVSPRRVVERHRSLRQAIQWSYDLLDSPEKSLWTECSRFTGPFDLAAIAAMSGVRDQFAVLDGLDALVQKSLIHVDRSSDVMRFRMLELLREFAAHQRSCARTVETRIAAGEPMAGATL